MYLLLPGHECTLSSLCCFLLLQEYFTSFLGVTFVWNIRACVLEKGNRPVGGKGLMGGLWRDRRVLWYYLKPSLNLLVPSPYLSGLWLELGMVTSISPTSQKLRPTCNFFMETPSTPRYGKPRVNQLGSRPLSNLFDAFSGKNRALVVGCYDPLTSWVFKPGFKHAPLFPFRYSSCSLLNSSFQHKTWKCP